MRPLSAVLLACICVAACTAEVRPAKVELHPVKVVIGGEGSGFCPPGQAKKGRC
jgi:hypothetical protein